MNSRKMKDEICARLSQYDWNFIFDRQNDSLRVEDKETKKGITISLPGIIAKWELRKEKAIDEIAYYIKEALLAMSNTKDYHGKEANIFPVIRSTSFLTESNEGVRLLFDEHTAETRIYYAIDLGSTYRLLDERILEQESWKQSEIKEIAKFNVRSLDTSMKLDMVAGNKFYFINKNDGYDASRILNESLLKKFKQDAEGTMVVAVPHQDVLILADILNETGYDVLAQMTMSFFASGKVPITALSFLYENDELEPIFILGKNRRKKD